MEKNRMIKFVDEDGRPVFEIQDGEFIRLIYGDGTYYIGYCRYIDEHHFTIDDHLWEQNEFAQYMSTNEIDFIPLK